MTKKKEDLPEFKLSRMEFFYLTRLDFNPYFISIFSPYVRHEYDKAMGDFDSYEFRDEIKNDEFPVLSAVIDLEP